ncbi:sugar nucleotide-binding protein, partial [Bifidobacterium callitrichos]
TVRSWAEIAAAVFEQTNGNGDKVQPISTEQYFANAKNPVAPRPVHSALDLSKIEQAGYTPADWETSLKTYVANELAKQNK